MQNKKEHYLSMHKYKIFQDQKDKRWKTTLPDETKKSGRRLIAKTNEEDLLDIVANYYEEEEKKRENPILRLSQDATLEDLYPIWFESRRLEVKNTRTVKRNHQEWKRYYQGTPITKIPMHKLTVNELKDWAHKMINDNEFNKRDYYNMTLIIKKCFEYASDEGICEDTWAIAKGKINTKKLKRVSKPENHTQIYSVDEKLKIINHAFKMFALKPWNIGIMTIPFLFLTGLRIGEVVALRYDDLQENEIHIRSGEVNHYIYDEEVQDFKYSGKRVENHTKSDAGIRTVPYTDSAKKIIAMIERSSEYYGYYDDGYIFCPASKRMTSNSIDHTLTRYCKTVGIPEKSAHKIRKTYISQAISSGVDLDTICRISGHADLKTTLESYLFGLKRDDEVYNIFNNIFQDAV